MTRDNRYLTVMAINAHTAELSGEIETLTVNEATPTPGVIGAMIASEG